jgi:hypothetical protein
VKLVELSGKKNREYMKEKLMSFKNTVKKGKVVPVPN